MLVCSYARLLSRLARFASLAHLPHALLGRKARGGGNEPHGAEGRSDPTGPRQQPEAEQVAGEVRGEGVKVGEPGGGTQPLPVNEPGEGSVSQHEFRRYGKLVDRLGNCRGGLERIWTLIPDEACLGALGNYVSARHRILLKQESVRIGL